MAPFDRIAEVISVERVRDGGSLSMEFTDGADDKWWLFFEVQRETDEASRTEDSVDYVRTGYGPPVLWKRGPGGSQTPVSWDDALDLLHKIEDQVPDKWDSAKWCAAMIRIGEAQGAPLSNDADLPAARRTAYSSWDAMRRARVEDEQSS